jgi:hypothetical protein
MWDAAPLEAELLTPADKRVGASDAVLVEGNTGFSRVFFDAAQWKVGRMCLPTNLSQASCFLAVGRMFASGCARRNSPSLSCR